MTIQKNPNGHDLRFVHGATASSLANFLNPYVPFVWFLGHMPHRCYEWLESTVPLNDTENITAQVRLVSYDMQLSTTEFLRKVSSFDDHGLVLIQANQSMPNTLDLSRIPEEHQDKVLMSNGVFLRIYLPHSIETASVVCYESGYLESING